MSARVYRLGRFEACAAGEVVPIAIVTNNPRYAEVRRRFQGQTVIDTLETGRGPVWGLGISPIGLELRFRLTSRASVYGSGSVGGLWFTREVPILYSRAFNYTFQSGGGVEWRRGSRDRITLGYQFHHLSNDYTAPLNPGVDANMIVLGWQRAWR